MRVLYFETTAYYPSSAHFLEPLKALAAERRCGFEFFDEAVYFGAHRSLAQRITTRLMGGRPASYWLLNREFLARARSFKPDLILIGKGRYLAPRTIRAIKQSTGAKLVNWASDDPFNPQNSSNGLRQSIPFYDLYISPRRAALDDIRRAGCPRVVYLPFGYKPEVHFPECAAASDAGRFACDVAFIGGADPDRAPYFERLLRDLPNLRLRLYGSNWNRYPRLRAHWRGEVFGREFRLAASGAAIVVNLVRRANRDDHVMRTFELPACGAFVLGERTLTHGELFEEGKEAVFFDSAAELVDQVRAWLPRDHERQLIADAGRRKVVEGHNSYADRLREIFKAAGVDPSTP
jgi:spore maturation protein CgeB